jgi:hypothetical protein
MLDEVLESGSKLAPSDLVSHRLLRCVGQLHRVNNAASAHLQLAADNRFVADERSIVEFCSFSQAQLPCVIDVVEAKSRYRKLHDSVDDAFVTASVNT